MDFILEPERKTPVAVETDVIVAGGGPAGVGAALGAARSGAKTLLVESSGALGGTATVGLMNKYGYNPDKGGVPRDVFDYMLANGGATRVPGNITMADPEALKLRLETLATEAGVELLYHSSVVGAVMDGKVCKGIIVENKGGRQALLARTVVDATGDGDVAEYSGAAFEVGRVEDGATVAMTLMFRLGNVDAVAMLEAFETIKDEVEGRFHEWYAQEDKASYDLEIVRKRLLANEPVQVLDLSPNFAILAKRSGLPMSAEEEKLFSAPHHPDDFCTTPIRGVVDVNLAHAPFTNPLDAKDMTRATVEARKEAWRILAFMRKFIPGLQDAFMVDTAAAIGVREARRIVGEYMMTLDDVYEGRKFDDRILRTSASLDLHSPDGTTTTKFGRPGHTMDIPYRALLPKEVDGLVMAGRCIAMRMGGKPPMGVTNAMLVGQAAGVAASLSARMRIAPRKVDAGRIQEIIAQQGVAMPVPMPAR